ncbi:hypothetical protein GCM10007304_03100 [Rhodococcoides trifolii]|uniref:Uncharacterized protein n=1 Tax=Rhodococcoides trifolii TaxID=908250 RepID=A0A917FLN6_9NOCA|nr:hypothetical protein GCM10007304_03100 [Rhodococcus trifolii]
MFLAVEDAAADVVVELDTAAVVDVAVAVELSLEPHAPTPKAAAVAITDAHTTVRTFELFIFSVLSLERPDNGVAGA